MHFWKNKMKTSYRSICNILSSETPEYSVYLTLLVMPMDHEKQYRIKVVTKESTEDLFFSSRVKAGEVFHRFLKKEK